ncbi:hypothetical protein [Brevundimonas sp.]|uniref:hypothetical protein n=1 Tax=Brevundimonas sp. TaxID=1871086 RepID=UPI0035B37DC1
MVDQLLKTERDYSELRQSYDAVVAKLTIERGHGDKQYRRASAAEAKLARAVEALRMARDALSTAKMWAKRKGGCDGAIDKIDRSLFAIKQTLAALAHPPAQGSEAIRRAAEAARDALKCEGPEHELIHQRDYFALDRIATGPNLQRALAAALSPQPGPASEGDGE